MVPEMLNFKFVNIQDISVEVQHMRALVSSRGFGQKKRDDQDEGNQSVGTPEAQDSSFIKNYLIGRDNGNRQLQRISRMFQMWDQPIWTLED